VADDARWLEASEHRLVSLARALIAGEREAVCAMVGSAPGIPPMISSSCAERLGDVLSKTWPALWRRGGARPGESIDGGRDRDGDRSCGSGAVLRGRIWERHAPIGLRFSTATLRLLRWLLTAPVLAATTRRRPTAPGLRVLEAGPFTVADQVMVYLALDTLTGAPAQAALAGQPLTRAMPLAWLRFFDALGAGPPPPFDELCDGAGAIVVESLTDELARRWRAVEQSKVAIEAPGALVALGAVQDAVLQSFLAACDRCGRRDLAGFVIDAAAPLLERGLALSPVRLDPTATLAQRAAARNAAGALLRAVLTWAAWDRSHRGVRFLDETYPTSQLLLGRFEAIGARGTALTQAWLAELAALSPSTAAPAGPSADTIDPL
jgi:hypothetical protein